MILIQLSGTVPEFRNLEKIIYSGRQILQTTSLRTIGGHSSGPADLKMLRLSNLFNTISGVMSMETHGVTVVGNAKEGMIEWESSLVKTLQNSY